MTDPRIEDFLKMIKTDDRSSPKGVRWHEFYEFLISKKRQGQTKPPVPLILAASGESDASKYRRLSDQLQWALQNDCLDEAIDYLQGIPRDHWNISPIGRWDQDSYWS